MNTFTTAIQTFIDDENGVTAIEYGLIAAMIATVLIAGLTQVTGGLSATFDKIGNALK